MLSLDEYLKHGTTTVSNLLFQYYKKVGMTEQEFILYLQLLQYQQQGIYFPSMDKISQCMEISIDTSFNLVQQLINKSVISMETKINEIGKTEDRYDLTPIFSKLEQVIEKEQVVKNEQVEEDKRVKLFNQFEQEFGRSLSPIELETIQQWLESDKYSIELIELALREAILNQAYSLKYMDRILLNWERKNLTSKQAVQKDQKKRLQEIEKKEEFTQNTEDLPTIPMYNWLNPNNK